MHNFNYKNIIKSFQNYPYKICYWITKCVFSSDLFIHLLNRSLSWSLLLILLSFLSSVLIFAFLDPILSIIICPLCPLSAGIKSNTDLLDKIISFVASDVDNLLSQFVIRTKTEINSWSFIDLTYTGKNPLAKSYLYSMDWFIFRGWTIYSLVCPGKAETGNFTIFSSSLVLQGSSNNHCLWWYHFWMGKYVKTHISRDFTQL